jgi:hypothetical protein
MKVKESQKKRRQAKNSNRKKERKANKNKERKTNRNKVKRANENKVAINKNRVESTREEGISKMGRADGGHTIDWIFEGISVDCIAPDIPHSLLIVDWSI